MSLIKTLTIISLFIGSIWGATQIYGYYKPDLSHSDFSQKNLLDLKIQMDNQPFEISSYYWQNNSLILIGNYTYEFFLQRI